jgi:hypothetical protein
MNKSDDELIDEAAREQATPEDRPGDYSPLGAMDPQSKEAQDLWEHRLVMRAARLGRLLGIGAPESFMAREQILIVKAMLEMTPQRLAVALASMTEAIVCENRAHASSAGGDA